MKKGMHDKGLQNLVTAILKCAVEDYIEEYKQFIENPTQNRADYIRILRKYFEENCSGLTSCGEAIVERAERLVKETFGKEKVLEAESVYTQMLNQYAA